MARPDDLEEATPPRTGVARRPRSTELGSGVDSMPKWAHDGSSSPRLVALHYVIYIVLMLIGLYAVLAKGNLVKKVIGLNILQTAVFLFYLSIGRKVDGRHRAGHLGKASESILAMPPTRIPLPHVLMLTAIVVGVSITAVALALIVRASRRGYGTIEESEILALDEAERGREGD